LDEKKKALLNKNIFEMKEFFILVAIALFLFWFYPLLWPQVDPTLFLDALPFVSHENPPKEIPWQH